MGAKRFVALCVAGAIALSMAGCSSTPLIDDDEPATCCGPEDPPPKNGPGDPPSKNGNGHPPTKNGPGDPPTKNGPGDPPPRVYLSGTTRVEDLIRRNAPATSSPMPTSTATEQCEIVGRTLLAWQCAELRAQIGQTQKRTLKLKPDLPMYRDEAANVTLTLRRPRAGDPTV